MSNQTASNGSNANLFRNNFGGLAGFDELKKYIKQGSEFCKEVGFIMQERADLESTYSKGLMKIASKLLKSSQNSIGSLAEGWKAVASSIELEGDLHKNLAAALLEDIAKPLKQLVEAQHKARKPIESTVDKSVKSLLDKRAEETKSKKAAYESAKSHEKTEEMKPGKNKDPNKAEKKQKQALDALRKADTHYCESCEKAEVARQEWDFSVSKASSQLQDQEEERIAKMNDYLNQYNSHISVLGPRLTESCEKLNQSVHAVDLTSDIRNVVRQRGSGQYTPEQILVDCYAEDKQFSMKIDRRKTSLQNYLLHLRQSIEREQKGREGVEKLLDVYRERPNFADPEAQDDARQRLMQVIFMTNFLEANHYKIASFLAELEGESKPSHKFAKYIEHTRDKQGMIVNTLKLPINLASEGRTGYDATSVTLQYGPNDPYSSDEEFDSDHESPVPSKVPTFTAAHRVVGRCRALYDYNADQQDELQLQVGNIINIYDKQPDGWWQGELSGQVGLFPATYVEEI